MVKGIMGVSNKQQTAVALDPLPEKWEWRANEKLKTKEKWESQRDDGKVMRVGYLDGK